MDLRCLKGHSPALDVHKTVVGPEASSRKHCVIPQPGTDGGVEGLTANDSRRILRQVQSSSYYLQILVKAALSHLGPCCVSAAAANVVQ
jgi:hypothetical protein